MELTDCLGERATAAGLQLGPSQQNGLRALGRLMGAPRPGVYLHGPAGRGKTWLLDAVASCGGSRVHRFHWGASSPGSTRRSADG